MEGFGFKIEGEDLMDGKRHVVAVVDGTKKEVGLTFTKQADGSWLANMDFRGLKEPAEVFYAVERIGFNIAKSKAEAVLGASGLGAIESILRGLVEGKGGSPKIEGFSRN